MNAWTLTALQQGQPEALSENLYKMSMHIQKQFLFKELMLRSEKHIPTSMEDLQWLTIPPYQEGGSTVLTPLPLCPLAPSMHVTSMLLLHHFTGSRCPQAYHLMAVQMSPTGPVPTLNGFFTRATPPATFICIWLWVPGEEDAFL